ncbi:MAG: XdhC family protein, partial [Chloroflexi bacterium]|nr:XdhC family protein [Chloroflexota bacterium]
EHALQILGTGEPAVVHYGISDEAAFAVGLSCGGEIDVLVEPFQPDAAWRVIRDAIVDQRPAALAVALSPPALIGRRLVLSGDGTRTGSLDDELDDEVAAVARQLLLEGGTRRLRLPRHGEECVVFVEGFPPPPHLYLLGAAFVAPPLARMAKDVGFHVTVADPRAAFATRERFPTADEVIVEWPDRVLEAARLDAYSYVVMLLHDPKFDVPALTPALRSDARYIGVMGSRRTHSRRVAQLREHGFSDEALDRMHAPIGMDLGGREPEQIAVAILAQMLAVSHGRDGEPLSSNPANSAHATQPEPSPAPRP